MPDIDVNNWICVICLVPRTVKWRTLPGRRNTGLCKESGQPQLAKYDLRIAFALAYLKTRNDLKMLDSVAIDG